MVSVLAPGGVTGLMLKPLVVPTGFPFAFRVTGRVAENPADRDVIDRVAGSADILATRCDIQREVREQRTVVADQRKALVGGVAAVEHSVAGDVGRVDGDCRAAGRALDEDVLQVVLCVGHAAGLRPAAAEDVAFVGVGAVDHGQVEVVDQRRVGAHCARRVGPGQRDLERLGGISHAHLDAPASPLLSKTTGCSR